MTQTRSVRSEARALIRLAVPIVMSLAAATLIGVIDTIMIAPLGTVPLAGASVTASVLIVLYSGLYGFASVAGVRVAGAVGRADAAALSNATRTALVVGLCAGVVGAAFMLAMLPFLDRLGQPPAVIAVLRGYWVTMAFSLVPFTVFYALKALFDATDKAWLGVAVAFLAVVLNVPANLILIHGIGGWAGFGLTGAGLASLFSQSASLGALWPLWRRHPDFASSRQRGTLTGAEVRTQLGQGGVIAAGYVSEGGAYAVAGLMMGGFGAAALAANQIVSSVGAVLYMVPLGVAIAVSIRIGTAIGAGDHARLTRIGRAALGLIVGWMALVMLAVLAGRGVVTCALSDDAQVVGIALSLFVIVAIMQIADGVQGTMLGAARGMMDNVVPVCITLVAYWIVALPLGYALGFWLGWGPNGVWIGYGIGVALAGGLVTWRFFRMAGRGPLAKGPGLA
ncbi:MAG: MATE family efflux transporter [Pseudomonadota bacterium]